MKILSVVPTYYPATRYGGPIYAIKRLNELLAYDHNVSVGTTSVDGPSSTPFHFKTTNNVDIYYCHSYNRFNLYGSSELKKIIFNLAQNSDVIHAQSIFTKPLNYAFQASLKYNKPLIVSPRGMLSKYLFHLKAPIKKYLWYYLEGAKILRHASIIHVTSAIERSDAIRFGLEPNKISIIPNGVDIPSECPRQSLVETPYILFLGRLSWKKRIDKLLSILYYLPTSIRLVVAGPAEHDTYSRLYKKAVKLHILDRVLFVPFVSGEQKHSLLANAKILVLPSAHENFGNVILEAWALSTPVAVTSTVGLADYVSQYRAGIILNGNIVCMAKQLNHVLYNDPLRLEMGQNGYKLASTRFTWPSVVNKTSQLYGSLC